MPRIIGIDFGTTSSRACALVDGRRWLISNQEGAVSTPSVVALPEAEDPLVGDAALRLSPLNPGRVVHSVKRLLGLESLDPGHEAPRSHGSLALVSGVFGRPPRRVVDDGVVATGAALQAGVLAGSLKGAGAPGLTSSAGCDPLADVHPPRET